MADSSGLYHVHLAVKMGFEDVVAKLFDLCPDLDQLLDNNGRNFVHLAVEEERKEYIVQWICRKAELAEAMNAQDNNGNMAMHLAVKAGHINKFARLLDTKKAHLCVTNKDGLTPRDLAISKRTVGFGFFNCQNPDLMMIQILKVIKCCRGIKRRDHFVSENRLQYEQKKEKLVENLESMAKTMAIGSVLIASATFAAAFSVSGAYKADFLAGNTSPGLNFAFKSFLLVIVYAFVCSIVTTGLLIQAALTFLDPIYRQTYILISSALIIKATEGFVASFALGVYVILTPVSQLLTALVGAFGALFPFLIQPYFSSNGLVTVALIKYVGWRRTFSEHPIVFGGSMLSIFVYIVVMASSLMPTTSGAVPHLVLAYGFATIFFSAFQIFPRGRCRLLSKLQYPAARFHIERY